MENEQYYWAGVLVASQITNGLETMTIICEVGLVVVMVDMK
jgi:hypothetical protein